MGRVRDVRSDLVRVVEGLDQEAIHRVQGGKAWC